MHYHQTQPPIHTSLISHPSPKHQSSSTSWKTPWHTPVTTITQAIPAVPNILIHWWQWDYLTSAYWTMIYRCILQLWSIGIRISIFCRALLLIIIESFDTHLITIIIIIFSMILLRLFRIVIFNEWIGRSLKDLHKPLGNLKVIFCVLTFA